MLPFSINSLDQTLSDFHRYYVQKHSHSDYQKVYDKVSNSNGLANFCGQSVNRGAIPTAMDFNMLTSNMFLLAGVEKITLAALIALKVWDERINQVYNMTPKSYVDMICSQIITNSKLRHL